MATSSSRHPVRAAGGRGRRPATSHLDLEAAAFELFDRHGFEATTVNAIAEAAGVGRRTFFRYFDSKNDVVWGSFSDQLALMREQFLACPADQPVLEAISAVVVEFNRVEPEQAAHHRRRLELILQVPALQAHSTLRYTEWRAVVAEFVARRTGVAADALLPQTIAHACLGTAIAAYEHWITRPGTDLSTVLATALRELTSGFAAAR